MDPIPAGLAVMRAPTYVLIRRSHEIVLVGAELSNAITASPRGLATEEEPPNSSGTAVEWRKKLQLSPVGSDVVCVTRACLIRCVLNIGGSRTQIAIIPKTPLSKTRWPAPTAAAIYTLVGTVKLNGIVPEAYLRLVPGCIAEHRIDRVEELLPWHVAASLPDVLRQAA
jgi:hypothetical protein